MMVERFSFLASLCYSYILELFDFPDPPCHLVEECCEVLFCLFIGLWPVVFGIIKRNVISQMYEEGEYKDLADYFTKVETKEEQTKGRSKYHRSRNLKEPVVKSRIVVGKIDDDPYVPKGYDLIEDSVVNGFNDFIFMKYQSYMIRKRKKPEPPKRPEPISEQKGSRHVGIWESIKKIFRKKGAK